MNILFIYISLPHLSENGVFVDLIKEFAHQGHSVKVATPARVNLPAGINKEAGIDVLRFNTDQLTNNSSNIQKGIAYLKLIYQFPKAIFRHFWKEKFDLIIGHSLPAEVGIIVKILKLRYQSLYYLMLCEYVWQDSVSLGYFSERNLICKYYKWLEKLTILSANFIGSPSQGNINFTLKFYPFAKNKNIHILHYSREPISLDFSNTDLRSKYNLTGKFVAIYGGNMSIAQKIENVISLAESCINYSDIVFILIGKGQEVEKSKKEVERRGLKNIVFLDFMPKDEYIALLSICDVGLVSLNEKLAVPNIPSKTLEYFNLSIPIVASIDYITDYGLYLEKAGAGFWSYAGDNDSFKENLLRLYSSPDLKKKMGKNGYKFYVEYMTPLRAYQTIINNLN
jgi:glycosyltransferase involved in cell wall biosynthesis